MGPTLLIVISIIIATIIVLLSEKFLNRSVTDFPPSPPSKHRSPFRNTPRDYFDDNDRDLFFDHDWKEKDLFKKSLRNKKMITDTRNSNRLVATFIFIALLIGLLLFNAA